MQNNNENFITFYCKWLFMAKYTDLTNYLFNHKISILNKTSIYLKNHHGPTVSKNHIENTDQSPF